MNDSDLNLDYTFDADDTFDSSMLNLGSRSKKKDDKLLEAKTKNVDLAKLHEKSQVFLAKLEKLEDNQIDNELIEYGEKVNELTINDVSNKLF